MLTKSTAEFLLLHLLSATLFFVCLALAGEGVCAVWYVVAAVILWPTVGTLLDFLKFYRLDLSRQ